MHETWAILTGDLLVKALKHCHLLRAADLHALLELLDLQCKTLAKGPPPRAMRRTHLFLADEHASITLGKHLLRALSISLV